MPRPPRERKQKPLRLDPEVMDAMERWADDDLRSWNAQVELVLRRALEREGRLPRKGKPAPGAP